MEEELSGNGGEKMRPIIPKEQRAKTISSIIVIAAGLLMLSCVLYFAEIMAFMRTLFGVLSPFLVGAAVAFLLTPLLRRVEKLFFRLFCKKKARPKMCRLLGMLVCYTALFLCVYTFARILIPRLIESVRSILNFIATFVTANEGNIQDFLLEHDILAIEGSEIVIAWNNIYQQLMGYTNILVENVLSLSKSVYTFVFQIFVGLVVSIYVLIDKERFGAQSKKICYAVFTREHSERLIFWFRRANRIFAGYISGKIIDSLIIGVLCYLGMLLLRLEYPHLISVIVGVTNIIPFFGPFIGAVPSILILLMVNPMSAIWFGIFILILQQLDGNVIGPYILGDSVGISPFWIMVAIIVGGGLFGFMGMLLSVPVFALFYAIVRAAVSVRLEKRDLPVPSSAYFDAPESLENSAEAPKPEEEKKP